MKLEKQTMDLYCLQRRRVTGPQALLLGLYTVADILTQNYPRPQNFHFWVKVKNFVYRKVVQKCP